MNFGGQGSNLNIKAQIYNVYSDIQNYTIRSEAAIDKYWFFEIYRQYLQHSVWKEIMFD